MLITEGAPEHEKRCLTAAPPAVYFDISCGTKALKPAAEPPSAFSVSAVAGNADARATSPPDNTVSFDPSKSGTSPE